MLERVYLARGGEVGRTHSLRALVIWPLTTHSFRDGAPFLLLTETPPKIFGRSLRFFHKLCTNGLQGGRGGKGIIKVKQTLWLSVRRERYEIYTTNK